MKEILVFCLVFSLLTFPLQCRAEKTNFGLSDEVIMNNLKRMDITRTEWDLENYLTRKEALTLAYIVKNVRGNAGGRHYATFSIKGTEETIDENREILTYRENAKKGIPYFHLDLKTMADYSLDTSFQYNYLYTGTEKNGKYYAEWNREVTYEEALAIVERMVSSVWEFMSSLYIYQPQKGFYKRAEEVGFINGSMLFCPNLKVTEDMLDEKIPVKDYMKLLYTGLFIYREDGGYLGNYSNRHISRLAELKYNREGTINGLNADSFEDIKQFMWRIGLIDEEKTKYEEKISRGEAIEIAYRIKINGQIESIIIEGADNFNNIENRTEEYVNIGLLKGREENGKKNLALEEPMTNEEGLIVILRMLNNENGNIGGQQLQIDENTDVFAIAEEEKLINVNEEAFGKSIQMTREEIKEPLTYGTFYNLVNDSLYIPRTFNKEKEIYGRYIEQYIEIPEKEKEENVDITL